MMGGNDRWRRTPTINQMEAAECGAASLAMVLATHGLWVPMEEMRDACGVSRDGSRASSILRAARDFGLEAHGFRDNLEGLRSLPKPSIVFVNLNHFVVLEGFAGGKVFLNDPALGRRAMPESAFDEIYSGVVLTFVPTDAFCPGGTPARWRARLLGWLEGWRPAVAHVLVAALGLVIAAIVVPGFTRVFIDDILIAQQDDWGPWLIGLMVATALVQGGLVWLKGALTQRIAAGVAAAAAARFIWNMLRLPVSFFALRYAGTIGERSALADELAGQAGAKAPALLTEGLTALVFALVMLGYSPILTAIAVACMAANMGLFLAMRRSLQEDEQRAGIDALKLAGRTMLGLQMIESLKAGSGENAFFQGWAGRHALLVNRRQTLGRIGIAFTVIPEFLTRLSTVLVLTAGGWLVMNGDITLGMLAAFQLLQGGFGRPVEALMQAGLALQKTPAILNQFDDVLAHPPAPEFAPPTDGAVAAVAGIAGAIPTGVRRLSGRLVLRDVAFGYNSREPALIEGFSLDLRPGERVALVGASGSGKSTVGRLVTGLFEPWRGEILFDGRPARSWPRMDLRNSLAVVDQDIVLFEGTVRDNIALWDETMPDATVVAAARDACVHDLILDRPGGYDGMLEEGGRNFSGGERQRIEIARALVGNPTLLVLDEATSALDPVTEKQVMDNLRRRGCSCLIVAHRLSTVRDCDEIIVMHQGAILERGVHDDLLARNGAYRRLLGA